MKICDVILLMLGVAISCFDNVGCQKLSSGDIHIKSPFENIVISLYVRIKQ